jgi:hypothetical protein
LSQAWTIDDINPAAGGSSPATDAPKIKESFESLRSNFSGATAPTDTVAHMFWADTTANLQKQRNAANSAWITIGSLLEPNAGVGMSRGNDSKNNATTPNTQWDLNADAIVLKDGNNMSVAKNPAVITCNISTAGPAANGRDQSGAFVANSFVHFFWIWNGTTLASLASASLSPTLPTGYTHSLYAGTVPLDGSGNLRKMRHKGRFAFYEQQQNILSGGPSQSEAAINTATFVPSNALDVILLIDAQAASTGTGAAQALYNIRLITGIDYFAGILQWHSSGTGGLAINRHQLTIPNLAQSFRYIWSGLFSAQNPSLTAYVNGYTMPNGG